MRNLASLVGEVEAYEDWLRTRCRVVEEGLRKKRDRMAADPFKFFRATCFRFARATMAFLPELGDAPKAPSVGDPHIENWGTWRDAEGRLVWGVNDFDDAARLPYTYDLLRLATSARLAPGIPGKKRDRAAAILNGYRAGLRAPGPCLAEDAPAWLRTLLLRPSAAPGAFRAELGRATAAHPPRKVADALRRRLPDDASDVRIGAWQKGGGSLGRPRFVAYGTWRGGLVAREAKARVPSAWDWARGRPGKRSLFLTIANGAFRAPDPFLVVREGFILRRIAPDTMKIDLSAADAAAFGSDLLAAMGADLAAIHAAAGSAEAIASHLDGRPDAWLHRAAKAAEEQVHQDYEAWAAHMRAA